MEEFKGHRILTGVSLLVGSRREFVILAEIAGIGHVGIEGLEQFAGVFHGAGVRRGFRDHPDEIEVNGCRFLHEIAQFLGLIIDEHRGFAQFERIPVDPVHGELDRIAVRADIDDPGRLDAVLYDTDIQDPVDRFGRAGQPVDPGRDLGHAALAGPVLIPVLHTVIIIIHIGIVIKEGIIRMRCHCPGPDRIGEMSGQDHREDQKDCQ